MTQTSTPDVDLIFPHGGAQTTPSLAPADRLARTGRFAVGFGGQGLGAAWLDELVALVREGVDGGRLEAIVRTSDDILHPVRRDLAPALPRPFAPLDWLGDARPGDRDLTHPALSIPGILLTQVAAMDALALDGLRVDEGRGPVVGHSHGVIAAELLRRLRDPDLPAQECDDLTARALATARLIAAAAVVAAHRAGLAGEGDRSPMLTVIGATRAEVMALLPEDCVLSAVNGPRRVTVTGPPSSLARLRRRVEAASAASAKEVEDKRRGGRVLNPVVDPVPTTVGFHHPGLGAAVQLVRSWAAACGLDVEDCVRLAQSICVAPVDWPGELAAAGLSDIDAYIDLGPGALGAQLAAPCLRGRGVPVIAAGTAAGRTLLSTPGPTPTAPRWSDYAPGLIDRGDGEPVVDTAFTRLTGKSPILLAGMTPTTADPAIVAAAANAGHWAELAGGGQVTEKVLADNLAALTELLDAGMTAQFNALYLDPYLWKMQIGGRRLVQKASMAGAPIDGVVVSAGIPDLDEATEIVRDLNAAGIPFVAFKPGTVAQIRQVIAIARAVPERPIIAHIEGGVAGGHHSWEDLDELLLATYADLRSAGVVVCVGGGIGSPEAAARYLTGAWAADHEETPMPVDGVLVGTAAMACREATTSPDVKQLLVDTPGTPAWVGNARPAGGVTSGLSQLGASIHEIDNAAARCGRLLDEVAGDADAVAARSEEIVAALAATAKPYFGDVGTMTYAEWLRRYLDLSGPSPTWLADTFRERFAEMVERTIARNHPAESGPIETPDLDLDAPEIVEAITALYPQAATCRLHPADVSFFVQVCARPGKPVNFVPVLDDQVRRWWRADSLWQAHDARYAADAVCIIPGPVSVAGITRADEPVAELLDRFETHVRRTLLADTAVLPATSRRTVGAADALCEAAEQSPLVVWADRVVANPLRVVGSAASTVPADDARVQASWPVGDGRVQIVLDLAGVHKGSLPVVHRADADAAMTGVLELAAGGWLPPTADDGSVSVDAPWSPQLLADHRLVTEAPGTAFATEPVPDAVVGLAWPAVFAVISQARDDAGHRCAEGLWDLVHLDHEIRLDAELPTAATELSVTARCEGVVDGPGGRVITIAVAIADHGASLARLTERFSIQGRIGASRVPEKPQLRATPTPRFELSRHTVQSPADLTAFAAVSGDHNPLHTDPVSARLAGFDRPIVHGMWLSAVGQRLAARAGALRRARPVHEWRTRWLGPLMPDTAVEVVVERVGVVRGRHLLEVTCRTDDGPVMVAQALVDAPTTVYAFPGQGVQTVGMGLAVRERSAAARKVWDDADRHTRKIFGFSILSVVRDNPTEIMAAGRLHRHPDGVLFLTQFTQTALATTALAQVAELRESGTFVEDAFTCGHSVGEYIAVAAVTGVIPLEPLLEIVFQRGMAMHHLVPRDADGRSDFRLAAIRPSQVGLGDDDVVGFVEELAAEVGEFLQVVNLNLAGSQYAVAGTVAGLSALEGRLEQMRARVNGRAAFILVPGIDVPFHSRVLHPGVPEFRGHLDALLPERVDPAALVGRYIPNLVPRLFTLERTYVEEVAELVSSEPLRDVLADWDRWAANPLALCRLLLIELLAWQFASPVRWIEAQDLLFDPPSRGGLGVEELVEIGIGSAPTLANLAGQTLRLPRHAGTPARILNIERDANVVFARDETPEPAIEAEVAEQTPAQAPRPQAPAVVADAARPDDLVFRASDATNALVALWTRIRPDQIGPTDTIDALCGGASSRRNQLLMDLGAELGVAAIDGAAEADWPVLAKTVDGLASRYHPFGPVLTEAINDQLHRAAASWGVKPARLVERVRRDWQLGDGWVRHVEVELSTSTRTGTSTRGGDLATAAADPLVAVDEAVQAVAARHGVTVALPSKDPGATVDAEALSALTDGITGADGVLASTARHLLGRLGMAGESVDPYPKADPDAELAALTRGELGADWARKVSPVFDAARAVLLDDRWASVREDLARAWADEAARVRCFDHLDEAAAAQARWWLARAREERLTEQERFYASVLTRTDAVGRYAEEIAVVTGVAPGSIAAAVVARLLGGGATVVVTASSVSASRLAYIKALYRDNAATGAQLWLVPANLASFADVDALVEWVGRPVVEVDAGVSTEIRPGLRPTLVFPFAAPSVTGTAGDAGPRREIELRVLLWGVERLVTGLARLHADHRVGQRLHVVLPGSPNRGVFGGDGGYGEAKAALDAFTRRWYAEPDWSTDVSLVHAVIGWVRGTGLMGHNDPLVEAVTAAGVRTWSTAEIAERLLATCTREQRAAAATAPLTVDLTGGLADADLNLADLARRAQEHPPAGDGSVSERPEGAPRVVDALTHPAGWHGAPPLPSWSGVTTAPEDMVVIVGAGEVGPCGSSRTRFALEVADALSPAGVLELAWVTGLITWESGPHAGWRDAASGESLTEADVVGRFQEQLEGSCGIRSYHDDGQLVDGSAPLLVEVLLEQDSSFVVTSAEEAKAFQVADPDRTRLSPTSDGHWLVTRLAGSAIRVPRRFALTRHVGAQVPDGFDPAVWGLGALAGHIDRLAAWNLVATVDAFISSGFEPAELLRWVHPTRVASTQGTGIGGMQSTRQMYVDALLGETPPNDILQEALPNVIAAHTVQSYVGSYGAMIHPVAACATAAVSIEEGVDKIRLGKAEVVVTGGFDDLGIEGIVGFANMNATANTDALLARGIDETKVCRPNDRRRGGFVEGQGGGTILLARGDVAERLGLPVLGVVAYAASFADGIHTSIPAPGIGALGAALGGQESALGRALAGLGLHADDVAVISKHDTSTKANDPNESELHERIATALGRSAGNPLHVISQKSLTGHAKGGAAAFQVIGLCQVMEHGVIPPNRSLDCVDPALAANRHLVWLREPLRSPVRAGLVTSLGFGHVSAVVAIAHPAAFAAALPTARREAWLEAARDRRVAGEARLLDAMTGGAPLYAKPVGRRFGDASTERRDEAAMLLDPDARLGARSYPAAGEG